MEKNFKKGDWVNYTTDNCDFNRAKNIEHGYIVKVKVLCGEQMYCVNGSWLKANEMSPRKRVWSKPTKGQMLEIKKAYPILKEKEIKVIYERGKDTESGFSGIFGFLYEKGEQNGKLRFSKGEFTPMTAKNAREYGF